MNEKSNIHSKCFPNKTEGCKCCMFKWPYDILENVLVQFDQIHQDKFFSAFSFIAKNEKIKAVCRES